MCEKGMRVRERRGEGYADEDGDVDVKVEATSSGAGHFEISNGEITDAREQRNDCGYNLFCQKIIVLFVHGIRKCGAVPPETNFKLNPFPPVFGVRWAETKTKTKTKTKAKAKAKAEAKRITVRETVRHLRLSHRSYLLQRPFPLLVPRTQVTDTHSFHFPPPHPQPTLRLRFCHFFPPLSVNIIHKQTYSHHPSQTPLAFPNDHSNQPPPAATHPPRRTQHH